MTRLRLTALKQSALRWALDPCPLRTASVNAIRRWELGDYEFRVGLGAVDRPHYAYAVWHAARLARRLGLPRISVVEFGVAGGNGLLSLERHAAASSTASGVAIDVYGFDSGQGLPAPEDFRDLPYHWKPGFFAMDESALRRRLKSSVLVLGDVRETLPDFAATYQPAPIGAVFQDFDLYSSTKAALEVFHLPSENRMPRIFTYFDDVIGNEFALYNDYTGERLAMREFNESHASQKISPAYCLLNRVGQSWHHKMFVTHDFGHPRYNDFVSMEEQQLRLAPITSA
jgi:hypothetical protein